MAIVFGVEEIAPLFDRFIRLYCQGPRPGKGVMADSGDLPANFQSGRATGDFETVGRDLFRYVQIGRRWG
jgi:hypothetical protein